MQLNVYLAGEIHTDWRDTIIEACKGLDIDWYGPVTDHDASDDCGVEIFGAENDKFWHDRKGAQLNAIRTQNLLKNSDIAIIRFGEKYKQWNAAFDAGYAAALDIPYITLHPAEHDHALKEVDGAANGVAREPEQVVQALAYIIRGEMPEARRDAAE